VWGVKIENDTERYNKLKDPKRRSPVKKNKRRNNRGGVESMEGVLGERKVRFPLLSEKDGPRRGVPLLKKYGR